MLPVEVAAEPGVVAGPAADNGEVPVAADSGKVVAAVAAELTPGLPADGLPGHTGEKCQRRLESIAQQVAILF